MLIQQVISKDTSLSELLKQNLGGALATSSLDIELTIPSNHKVHLIDDLHNVQIHDVNIRIVIQEAADCALVTRIVDPKNQHALSRTIALQLVGRQAQGTITLLCFGAGQQTFKFITRQEHLVPETSSNLIIRSVLDDASMLSSHNVITIVPGAQQTSAEQESKAILLSRATRATIIPVLEIEANDVKCAHGAAISRFDDEQLFYLQSRGLPQEQAQELLIEAFLC